MQDEVNRKFSDMMVQAGYRPSVAETLNQFLRAAPGEHRPDESAVVYAIGKLWVEDPKKGSNA